MFSTMYHLSPWVNNTQYMKKRNSNIQRDTIYSSYPYSKQVSGVCCFDFEVFISVIYDAEIDNVSCFAVYICV